MHKELTEYIAARLPACSVDELRVIDYVLAGIEQGREDYGPLDLATNGRDWLQERAAEARDILFYTACYEVAAQRRRQLAMQMSLHTCRCGPGESCFVCIDRSVP